VTFFAHKLRNDEVSAGFLIRLDDRKVDQVLWEAARRLGTVAVVAALKWPWTPSGGPRCGPRLLCAAACIITPGNRHPGGKWLMT